MCSHGCEPAHEVGFPHFAGGWRGPHRHWWGGSPWFGGWGGPRRWGWGRPPFGGPPHFGPPGAWGRRGPHPEREQRWATMGTLRPAVGSLIALIRAAEPSDVQAIEGVLADARRRIAAILAESQPTTPSARQTSDHSATTML